ncbi:hypothetical protein K525DRAFT_275308 [Schizophyllum commune Loenen D]|nr:hypothetical protein K525DRAFT_275308 [Schizophyllum commune Loenen D]
MSCWLESKLQPLKARGTNVNRELTSQVLVFAQENDNFCDVYWESLMDDEKFIEGQSEACRQIGEYFRDHYLVNVSAESAPCSSGNDVLRVSRRKSIKNWLDAHDMSYDTLRATFEKAVLIEGMEKWGNVGAPIVDAQSGRYWDIFIKEGVPRYLYKGDVPLSHFRLWQPRFRPLASFVQQDTAGALWAVRYILDPVTLGGVFAFGMHSMAGNDWTIEERKQWASTHLIILIHTAFHMPESHNAVEYAAQAIQTFWEYLIPLYEHAKPKGEEDLGPSMMQRVVSDSLRERSRQP